MKTHGSWLTGMLTAVLLATSLAVPAPADPGFSLAAAVPDDVFLCVVAQNNPEREFLNEYWTEVFEAFMQCGFTGDLMDLINSAAGTEGAAELTRLKERASELLSGVDWEQLAGREMAFAERFRTPLPTVGRGVPILLPDLVLIFRGTPDSTDQNYAGLVAILDAAVEEINGAVGSPVMSVQRNTVLGADVACVPLMPKVRDADQALLTLCVARKTDLIIITTSDQMLTEVLELMSSKGRGESMATSARFKAAFAQLPPAEDAMVFTDFQALFGAIQTMIDGLTDKLGQPDDVYLNSSHEGEAYERSNEAFGYYEKKDYEQALKLMAQAHEMDPRDSRITYNLACIQALLGNQDAALELLEEAVESGFYSPRLIASDSDLNLLRAAPRYEAALKKAQHMLARRSANDVIVNSTKSGKAHELCTQAWHAYELKDYTKGLDLVQQAYDIAPDDSRVLYYLACFHALLDDEDLALSFLERAVAGGFYSPKHISSDSDLESIRGDDRYAAALESARDKAAEVAARDGGGKGQVIAHVVHKLLDAVSIIDYIAAVETTDGYTTHTESVAALTPDAAGNPIYPVFANSSRLTDFDRFLPRETVSFSVAGGIDLGALCTFIEDTIREGGPAGEELMNQWAALQTELGFDLRADVLAWIGGSSVSVTLEDGAGTVLLIEVMNEDVAREKVNAALDFLSTKLGELAASNPMLAMLMVNRMPTLNDDLEGFENLRFAMVPQPIVWGVADGHLIFGSSAEAVLLCLDTAQGQHPGIRDNARVMTEALVPDGPFSAVSLTDLRELGNELAQGIGMVSMMGGMMGAFIPDPQVQPIIMKVSGMLAKLTPVVNKIDFFKSTASRTTFDGRAWRTSSATHYFSPEERAQRGGRAPEQSR